MIELLVKNMGTIIVGLMVAGIVFLIVASLVKSKRTGKNSCGCGCEDCLMSNGCKMKVKAK